MSNLWRKKVRITDLWNRNTLRLVRRLRKRKVVFKRRNSRVLSRVLCVVLIRVLSHVLSHVKSATTLVNHE